MGGWWPRCRGPRGGGGGGRVVASGNEDGTVWLWEARFAPSKRGAQFTEERSADFGHSPATSASGASHDQGKQIAERSADMGDSPAAPPSGWGLLATLQGHTSGVWGGALSGGGRLLASGSCYRTIRLWEGPGGQPLATL